MSIGDNTFFGCVSLASLTLSYRITDIGLNAFAQCRNLKTVSYSGTKQQWYDLCPYIKQGNEYLASAAVRCSDGTLNCVNSPNGEHALTAHAGRPASCTQPGWTAYETCSYCAYTTYQAIPKLGHDLEYHEGRSPTCTEPGWYAYKTCTRCSYTTYQARDAFGHQYKHYEAKAPTCSRAGYEAYDKCARCGYTTYKELPALGHDIVYYDAKAPTCTEPGRYAYKECTRCSYTTFKARPALGHQYKHFEAKAPTCTRAGCEAYDKCARCGYTTYKELPALGHTPVNIAYQSATFFRTGQTGGKRCSRCDLVLEKPEVLPQRIIAAPTVTVSGTKASVSWKQVGEATGYLLYVRETGVAGVTTFSFEGIDARRYTFAGESGHRYSFTVRPVSGTLQGWESEKTVITLPVSKSASPGARVQKR